jgi:hypothetical protein
MPEAGAFDPEAYSSGFGVDTALTSFVAAAAAIIGTIGHTPAGIIAANLKPLKITEVTSNIGLRTTRVPGIHLTVQVEKKSWIVLSLAGNIMRKPNNLFIDERADIFNSVM